VSAYPGKVKKIQIHCFIAELVENKPKYINNHCQMYKINITGNYTIYASCESTIICTTQSLAKYVKLGIN
jgi:hypothetical protein